MWDVGPGWREVGTGIVVALLLYALARGLSWIVWRALKPIIDVVRYIGDRQLRDYVQAQFLTSVKELNATSPRIVVAAHSLGTVITVDALLSHPENVDEVQSIDLVTQDLPCIDCSRASFPAHIHRCKCSLRRSPARTLQCDGRTFIAHPTTSGLAPSIANHKPAPLSKRMANA